MKKFLLVLIPILFLAGCGASKINNNTVNQPESKNILDLSYSSMSTVDPKIFDNSSIEELNLSHNSLKGALPAEIRKLTNLKKLDISYNRMTGLPAELGQLSNLESLDVSHNDLTGLPNEIGNLKKLKTLNISANNYSVKDLEAIRKKLPKTTFITQ